ncbi:MAG: D-alanine--D-alanine ligase [Sedimentisphaerales bacterium]|nr:D-alanine--D-alanine ligase [Sedimentisphaerales bacterium]
MDLNIPDGLKVAVLMGAFGAERQISLLSGKCIADALRKIPELEVIEHDYSADSPQILDDKSIDVFFLAFHGEFGEGGQMQQLCEQKGLIFTGCDSVSSRLAFDKAAFKRACQKANLPVPKAVEIKSADQLADIDSELKQMGEKFVIKPVRQGSSVGIQIVEGLEKAKIAAEECSSQFSNCLIEEFITGRELTVGILENKPLPVIEIKTAHQFYDYDAKYNDDHTQFLFDTIQDTEILSKINSIALESFNTIGCRDFSRVDMILSEDNTPFVIEINTIPGFTTHSLLPKAAAKGGIDMSQLCLRIIKSALERADK